MGGKDNHPIPNNFPQSEELSEVAYTFFTTAKDDTIPAPEGRWSSGPSIDGHGEFVTAPAVPQGEMAELSLGDDRMGVQQPQMGNGNATVGSFLRKTEKAIKKALK